MNSVSVRIISKSEELPEFTCNNFFHSIELFKILERTPAHTPYMALAVHKDGHVLGHILAIVRRRGALLHPTSLHKDASTERENMQMMS